MEVHPIVPATFTDTHRKHAQTVTSPRGNNASRRRHEAAAARARREKQRIDYLAAGGRLWTPKRRNGLRFVDIFCGAGGSSIGLSSAGYELLLAANHWRTAIDTHAANFTSAEHLCADVNNYDFRYLPRGADVLWASPICTELSPAGGNGGPKHPDGAADMLQELGHVSDKGKERTRATFMDIIRASEVWRFKSVLVENVPDVAERWELFDWWLSGMERLGYRYKLVSVNSAHVGGDGIPYAPQWRDRLYIVFIRKDIGRTPDVTPRPLSRCATCETDVHGVQTWAPSVLRRKFQVGRYRRNPHSSYGQYWYTCPNSGCGRRVEPYVMPAVSVIDFTDIGVRIGDLPRTARKPEGLAPKTMTRIRAGMRKFGPRRIVTTTCPQTHTAPPMSVPVGGTWAEDPVDLVESPARTVMANEKGCEALVTPHPFLAALADTTDAAPLDTARHHALIVPYYTTGSATTSHEPLGTVSTHDRFAMVTAEELAVRAEHDVFDAYYRMLKARESLRAQTFPEDYLVLGGSGEQTMQAGNAVSCNVAWWIGEQVAKVLTPHPEF